jgi:hypothetical protein
MFESEIVLFILIGTWVLYELYGKNALEWITGWTSQIRLVGGILVIFYIWYSAKETPEGFQTTIEFAKQFIKDAGTGGMGTTKEKRNVTNLMKKKVAADQQWRCGTCRTTLDETFEVDHKVALFQGGTNDMTNLVALCPHCHRKKTMAERLA